MSAYEFRTVQTEVELELSNAWCAELVAQEEAERKRVVELEKVKEALNLENSTLETKKVSLEDEFFTQERNIIIMLGETFNQVIWKANLLYKGPPTEGDFDVNKDVYEGRLVTFSELAKLRASTSRVAHEDEDEDH